MILVALLAWPFVAGIAAWVAGRRRAELARWVSVLAMAAGLVAVVVEWIVKAPDFSVVGHGPFVASVHVAWAAMGWPTGNGRREFLSPPAMTDVGERSGGRSANATGARRRGLAPSGGYQSSGRPALGQNPASGQRSQSGRRAWQMRRPCRTRSTCRA